MSRKLRKWFSGLAIILNLLAVGCEENRKGSRIKYKSISTTCISLSENTFPRLCEYKPNEHRMCYYEDMRTAVYVPCEKMDAILNSKQGF